MNDTDELYTHVRESFGRVHLDEPVEQVAARGRSLRRRRVAVPFALTAVAAVALSTTLGGTPPQRDVAGPAATSPGTHIRLAGWSLDSGPEDTVTLTVRVPPDAAELTKALADAGVRAQVHVFESGADPDCVDESLPELHDVVVMTTPGAPGTITQTIRRDAMPAGSVLHFMFFQHINGGRVTAYGVMLLGAGVQACRS